MKHVLFTATMLAVAVGYLALALQMPRGSLAFPGPGFYPTIVGVFMVLASGVSCALAVFRLRKERLALAAPGAVAAGGDARTTTLAPVLQLLALLLLYIYALPYVGFLPAISIFLLLAMRIFGYRNWPKGLLFTGIMVAASYLVFVHWLAVALPRGLLDDYL